MTRRDSELRARARHVSSGKARTPSSPASRHTAWALVRTIGCLLKNQGLMSAGRARQGVEGGCEKHAGGRAAWQSWPALCRRIKSTPKGFVPQHGWRGEVDQRVATCTLSHLAGAMKTTVVVRQTSVSAWHSTVHSPCPAFGGFTTCHRLLSLFRCLLVPCPPLDYSHLCRPLPGVGRCEAVLCYALPQSKMLPAKLVPCSPCTLTGSIGSVRLPVHVPREEEKKRVRFESEADGSARGTCALRNRAPATACKGTHVDASVHFLGRGAGTRGLAVAARRHIASSPAELGSVDH